MWISKIELRKFKSYDNQVFKFPAPSEDGRHIILIGGMNGYGKTTLLQAIYLGLYGNEAIDSLIRAGLMDETNYKEFQTFLYNTIVRMNSSYFTCISKYRKTYLSYKRLCKKLMTQF